MRIVPRCARNRLVCLFLAFFLASLVCVTFGLDLAKNESNRYVAVCSRQISWLASCATEE